MSIINEFKKFISKGNVVDLAVGVIIGTAFTSIVNALVNYVIMPVISIFTVGIDFTSWKLAVGKGETASVINYGNFIAAVLNFFIIALAIFVFVKGINKLNITGKETLISEKQCPYCKETVNIEASRCPHCTSELK